MSVQISLIGLSFLISDADSGDLVFFHEENLDRTHTSEELSFVLESVFKKHEPLSGPFKEITVVFSTIISTVVPKPLFDETKAIEYLKFNSKLLPSDFVAYDLVENTDWVVVYIPFVNINNFFFERFGTFQYYHATTLLLDNIVKEHSLSKEPKAYLHIQKDFFTLSIISDQKLHLCNSYNYQTDEDFIYYLLFGFEQLKLDPDQVPLSLSGNISQEDSLYELIYTYIRHVTIPKDMELAGKGTEQVSVKNFLLNQLR
ncbi:MAG: DUF3822 family protein [Flavobacteriaceae bacterium]|nr:DUF3822 family protein [Flavobacteriaceae bacterium]